ncbi:MAG: RlmE family RNA methyltransferase [Pseudomonadota bacterium]
MPFKVKDHYYHLAKKQNFLARSVFKLQEIDKRFKILKLDNRVLDLGYYPGSWIQHTSVQVGKTGLVIGVDIQEINKKLSSLKNVKLFKKDVFEMASPKDFGIDGLFDVVLSDMAPNTSGIKCLDQDRSHNLVEKIFIMLPQFLQIGGNLVVKVFDGHDVQVLLKEQKKNFKEWRYLRPKSTRSVSKEFFVIGKDFRP